MSFLRKKKVKFNVELVVEKLTDVPLLNAVIFAKIRLIDCGSFVGVTLHRPVTAHQVDFMSPSPSIPQYDQSASNIRLRVQTVSGGQGQLHGIPSLHRHSTIGLIDDMALCNNVNTQSHMERRHSLSERSPRDCPDLDKQNVENQRTQSDESEQFVDFDGNVVPIEKNPQPFEFVCFIPYDSKYTGELEACRCKISLRKEDRAGRTPQKLGFVILNLSEFAGSGSEGISRPFLLEGYGSQRQDNSRVHVHIRMQHNSADPLFKVPKSLSLQRHHNGSVEDLLSPPCEPLGHWLNPADRKAPPPSPVQNANASNNGNTATATQQLMSASMSSAITNPIQIDSLSMSSHQTGTWPGSHSSSLSANVSSAFSTVPGGLGHNMSMRVQKTRRDPGDVIDEVLAENSATISTVRERPTLSSSGSDDDDEFESS